MLSRIQIVAVVSSLILLGVIFELVRKRRLREEYSLLWLLAGFTILLASLWKGLLFFLTRLLGIIAPSNAIFLIAIIFILAIVLHFSTVISRLSEQNKELIQTQALLNWKFEELKKSRDE